MRNYQISKIGTNDLTKTVSQEHLETHAASYEHSERHSRVQLGPTMLDTKHESERHSHHLSKYRAGSSLILYVFMIAPIVNRQVPKPSQNIDYETSSSKPSGGLISKVYLIVVSV